MCAPLVLLGTTLLAAAPPAAGDPTATVHRTVAAMGTSLVLDVEARDRATALAASEAALGAVEAVETRLSTWRTDSELARLQRWPAGEAFPASPELVADLSAAQALVRATDGAFDPGAGALVALWDLRGAGRVPSAEALADALPIGSLLDVRLAAGSVTRPASVVIEEGGFGKGVGLDAALAALEEAGARRAILDLGGQIAFLGEGPVPLALVDPDVRTRPVARLDLHGGSVATSANSERAVRVDGTRIGHILDPRSGRPAADFGSLSVVAPDATTADGLSTGLYVMGPDAALAWAVHHPGVDVVVVQRTGTGLRIRASAGLRDRLEALVDDAAIEYPETKRKP